VGGGGGGGGGGGARARCGDLTLARQPLLTIVSGSGHVVVSWCATLHPFPRRKICGGGRTNGGDVPDGPSIECVHIRVGTTAPAKFESVFFDVARLVCVVYCIFK
jgi:hypothetical protein